MASSDVKGFARGFFAVVIPTCGVFFAIIAINRAELGIQVVSNFGLGIGLIWMFLFFPYLAAIPELFSSSGGLAFALLQWAVVGTAVGLFTSRTNRWRAFAWAIVAVIVMSVLTHFLLRGLGYKVIVEGP